MDERIIVRKPRSNRPYINGADLYAALVAYYAACKAAEAEGRIQPIIPRYIGDCIHRIALNLSQKVNFVMYTFRQDMIGDAIVKMVEAVNLQKFDPIKSQNPFAYFSQITWNCFLQRIEKENREAYIKHKNIQQMVIFDEANMLDEAGLNNDEHNRVIGNFEKPKEKNNYAGHRNLSYAQNRRKKPVDENPLGIRTFQNGKMQDLAS